MISRLLQFRQLFLTLWFLAYFIWVQPMILTRVDQAPEQKNIALALILVAIQVLELVGMWFKFPAVQARVRVNPSKNWGQLLVIFLLLTHIFVTAMLTITTIRLFGLDLNEDALLPGLAALAIFFTALTKEGLFLIWWFQLMGMRDTQLPGLPKFFSPMVAEITGDGLLAIFSALAYTVVWEQVASDTFIVAGTPLELVLEYCGAGLFFLMVFPATRGLYYAEELLTQQPKTTRLQSVFFLLITMIAAIVAIPKTY